MLKVQEFLQKGHSLEELKNQLGIKYVEHNDGRVILNYCQIETPKTHPIAIECRGLVLDSKNNWKVVAKAYDRFFNLGEHKDLTDSFDWSEFECYTKEDGSIMLLYYHNGTWKVNTRGSFADTECNFSGKTWSDLFFELLPNTPWDMLLSRGYTYIFEMWTPFNKVIRQYDESCVILTGIVENETGHDVRGELVDVFANDHNLKRPERYTFTSLVEIENFLKKQEEDDPTFEGVIVRDRNKLRLKIKSKTYVALHQLSGNGNIYNPKNLVPFILAGETDEVLTYFPEVKEQLNKTKEKMDAAFAELMDIFYSARTIEEQKKFAIYVTKTRKTPFTGLLFTLKKKYGKDATDEQLEALWRDNADHIVKALFK